MVRYSSLLILGEILTASVVKSLDPGRKEARFLSFINIFLKSSR